jgi:hypothetical protein
METWKPSEVIVHESVKDDPATIYFLGQRPGVGVKFVNREFLRKLQGFGGIVPG